jgi:hypothetical protein
MYLLVTTLAVLTRSSLFFVLTVAQVSANEMSRSIVRSIPRCDLSIRDFPKLERLGASFKGDELLS